MSKPLKSLEFLAGFLIVFGLLGGCGGQEMPFLSNAEQGLLNAKYELALIKIGGEPRLQVKLDLTMPRDEIYLQLPNTFLRKDRLFDRIEGLKSLGKNSIISSERNHDNFKLLHSRKGERVSLRYFVKNDEQSNLATSDSFYAPIIRDDYFNFVGSMALVVPFVPKADGPSVPLNIKWNLPEGYEVYNSFGSKQNNQNISSNFAEMWDAVYTGGPNFRTKEIEVRGRPVIIALEGHWSKIPDEIYLCDTPSINNAEKNVAR